MSNTNEQALLYQAFIQKTYKSKVGRNNNKGAVTLMRSLLLMESTGCLTQKLRDKNVTFIKRQMNIAFKHIIQEKETNTSNFLSVLKLKKELKKTKSATELVGIAEKGLRLLDNKK